MKSIKLLSSIMDLLSIEKVQHWTFLFSIIFLYFQISIFQHAHEDITGCTHLIVAPIRIPILLAMEILVNLEFFLVSKNIENKGLFLDEEIFFLLRVPVLSVLCRHNFLHPATNIRPCFLYPSTLPPY